MDSHRFVELIQSFSFSKAGPTNDERDPIICYVPNTAVEQENHIPGLLIDNKKEDAALLYLSFDGDVEQSQRSEIASVGGVFVKTSSDYEVGYIPLPKDDMDSTKKALDIVGSSSIPWRQYPLELESMELTPFFKESELLLEDSSPEEWAAVIQDKLGEGHRVVDIPEKFVASTRNQGGDELTESQVRSIFHRKPEIANNPD